MKLFSKKSKKRESEFFYDEKLCMLVAKKPVPYKSTYCASPMIITKDVKLRTINDDE